MEIEKYKAIAANLAIQKALRRIELFVNNLHVRKPTRAFWEQLKRESFESINAALLSQNKETKTMETEKTIADLKAAMWNMFTALPVERRKQVCMITADSDGKTYAWCIKCGLYLWAYIGDELFGKLDLTEYPPDAWKQSLILVRDGKRIEETPTPPANGFVPVRMEDFNAKNYIYRGIYLIVRDFKEETDGKYSASFEVSGSDIRRFKSLTDLNAFLKTQWLALGGQKGDK